MARYKLSEQDRAYALEFLREPFGYRSPNLQQLLNLMRNIGPEGKYVIICKEPHRSWTLGKLPARRGQPVIEFPEVTYSDLATAECDVFKRRWRDLGGPDLATDPNEKKSS